MSNSQSPDLKKSIKEMSLVHSKWKNAFKHEEIILEDLAKKASNLRKELNILNFGEEHISAGKVREDLEQICFFMDAVHKKSGDIGPISILCNKYKIELLPETFKINDVAFSYNQIVIADSDIALCQSVTKDLPKIRKRLTKVCKKQLIKDIKELQKKIKKINKEKELEK